MTIASQHQHPSMQIDLNLDSSSTRCISTTKPTSQLKPKQSPGILVQKYGVSASQKRFFFVVWFFRKGSDSRIRSSIFLPWKILRWLFTWPETLTCQAPRSAVLDKLVEATRCYCLVQNFGEQDAVEHIIPANEVYGLGHRLQVHQMQIVSRLQHDLFWRFCPSIAFIFFFL